VIAIEGLTIVLCLVAATALVLRFRTRAATNGGTRPALFVGTHNNARIIARFLANNPYYGYHIVKEYADGLRVSHREPDEALKTVQLALQRSGACCVFIERAFMRVKPIVESAVAGLNRPPPQVKVVSNPANLLLGAQDVSFVCDLGSQELLQRGPVHVDLSNVGECIEDQTVLVTGAGGSIGSELCRQISVFNPARIILVGHGENSLFSIQQELALHYDFTRAVLVLADVADAARIRSVFSEYRPHIVFHAAAHKHVPLVENNICEAIKNNILGTHVVALAAAAAGCAKLVLLSTDKAVQPSSVMGATKRVAELICQSFAHRTPTEFVSVRFGNVLGSRGSALSLFKLQIDNGGPVTVTHPAMERYFMSIPEAVSLVLEAMAIGRDGQVMVLEMGKPVNITTLAEAFIRLLGLRPGTDVQISYTGIRPGEKLYEELLTAQEGLTKTQNEGILAAQQEQLDYQVVQAAVKDFRFATHVSDEALILKTLRALVPSFTHDDRVVAASPTSSCAPQEAEPKEPAREVQPEIATPAILLTDEVCI